MRATESYSGENVGHRPGERAAVLPRATIGLGCVGSSLADPHYNKQANWNPDGSITLLGGVGRDNILIQRFSMPIPSGVTFS